MTQEPTLTELRKQIDDLKKEKKEQMVLATSLQERDKLLGEIAQLEEMKKSPSGLKRFGKTFGKGLRMTGKALFGGISKISRNLDRNAPEYKGFAGSMFSAQKSPTQSTQDANSISRSKPMKKKVKGKPKKRKVVKKRVKARRMVNNSQPKQQNLWDMP